VTGKEFLLVAEQKDPEKQKSLEMRIAELEDKLSKVYITEEEIKAYQKVVGLLSGGQAGVGAYSNPQFCVVCRWPIPPCACRYPCVCFCFECFGGCLPGGGAGSGGSGFGSLGT
jgi:hypothetical protein